MRKIILLCVLAIGMMADAQTVQTIAKPLKLNIVAQGTAADSVLVRGADKIVKFVPRSAFGGGSQVNSDWNATTGVAQILNKPLILPGYINSTVDDLGIGDTALTPMVNRVVII